LPAIPTLYRSHSDAMPTRYPNTYLCLSLLTEPHRASHLTFGPYYETIYLLMGVMLPDQFKT